MTRYRAQHAAAPACHLEDIRAKIDDLTKLERLLSRTVARCSGKKVPDCPVLDILDSPRP
jgi:MerR family transcriptional regulator, mercuric resistance operon regulatory protein